MYTFIYVIFTLIVLSTTFARCPDTCSCEKFKVKDGVVFLIHDCDNLQYLSLDIITSDVTDLLINDNNINVLSNIDEQVTNRKQVKYLDLLKNIISKIEVNALRVFDSLERLFLDYNNISNIPNGLFKTLPNLTDLSLSHNQHLILPEDGFESKTIVHLNIAYCNLTVIPPKFFDTMPNIKSLQLGNNRISYLDSNIISHFKTMEHVDLNNNNLTVFQPEFVNVFRAIDTNIDFHLEGNPFRCDCQFRNGVEMYVPINFSPDEKGILYNSLNELKCILPPESMNNNDSLNQEVFLKDLDCDVSNKLYDGDSLSDNDDIHYNMWSTISYTALWIVLGIVVVGVLFVAIVVIVRRQRSLPINPESLSQLDLLRN